MTTGQLVLGLITAVAATAAALLSWWAWYQSTGQREHQARREEWWRRFQWATGLAISADDGQVRVGLALLSVLSDSPLATPDELDAMSAVSDEILEMHMAPLREIGDDEHDDGDNQREVACDGGARATDRDDGRPATDQD